MLVQFKTISKIVNKEAGVSFKGTPRKPGSLPTHGAAEKTLVGADHVILSKTITVWGGESIKLHASTYK